MALRKQIRAVIMVRYVLEYEDLENTRSALDTVMNGLSAAVHAAHYNADKRDVTECWERGFHKQDFSPNGSHRESRE